MKKNFFLLLNFIVCFRRPDPMRYSPHNVFLQPSRASSIPGGRFPQCVTSPLNSPRQQQVIFHRNNNSNSNNSGLSNTTSGSTTLSTSSSSISSTHLLQAGLVTSSCSSAFSGVVSSGNAASVFLAKRPSLQDHPLPEVSIMYFFLIQSFF